MDIDGRKRLTSCIMRRWIHCCTYKSIELIQDAGKSYTSPRRFHEQLEMNIRQGDGWRFNYRGTRHIVPSDTLVLTQPGEAHQADCTSERNCIFRGIRVSGNLLQQVTIEVAGRDALILSELNACLE
jgi:hypothetical protein